MVKYAIFSVTDKSGIVELGKHIEQSHTILASGGTAERLRNGGVEVTDVASYTGSPEMFGGRVKTLHPKIHGGILFEDTKLDRQEADDHDVGEIDLVVCNLYQFKKAVASNSREDLAIEHIDIGGPTLIRAAAKNYDRVSVLVDPTDYDDFIDVFPDVPKNKRLQLASKAFSLITSYDMLISKYMNKIAGMSEELLDQELQDTFYLQGDMDRKLRYGENPHQDAALYNSGDNAFFENLSQNDPSYNNLLDLTAGWYLVNEFEQPACAIIKHRSPCGVATAESTNQAYLWALETDKMSAYGGVYVFNEIIDEQTATELVKMFVDVLFAPDYTNEALQILSEKDKMTILKFNPVGNIIHDLNPVPGGFVVQQKDYKKLTGEMMNVVSERQPDDTILETLKFAWYAVKHARSNAIVVAKDSRALGIGSGQTSRFDATTLAIERAGDEIQGSVLVGDAFFPFADSIEKAADVGITAVMAPGGSIRDQEVIDAADKHDIILVFTSIRAFKH